MNNEELDERFNIEKLLEKRAILSEAILIIERLAVHSEKQDLPDIEDILGGFLIELEDKYVDIEKDLYDRGVHRV